MKNILFQTDRLSIGYKTALIEEINLTVQEQKTYALTGANGCGKSTFIRTICGLIKPLHGNITKQKNLQISTVPQVKKIRLEFPITVERMLKMPEEAKGFLKRKRFSQEEMKLMEKLGVSSILHYLIGECSGGQLQKVLITRSLLSQAKLIFLDEPMDALDNDTRIKIMKILQDYTKKRNSSLFIITHNLSKSWLDNFSKIYTIEDGKIS